MMKLKTFNGFVLLLVLSVIGVTTNAAGDSAATREDQVKAAFLYNFLKFVDWPQGKISDAADFIVIGVIGESSMEKAFKPFEDKAPNIDGKPIVVRYFKSFQEIVKAGENDKDAQQKEVAALRKCHLLFIVASEEKNSSQILEVIKDSSVLTVGETEGFLDSGGIINFVIADGKICFEVNMAAAGQAGLEIRSQLLRLAKKVVQ